MLEVKPRKLTGQLAWLFGQNSNEAVAGITSHDALASLAAPSLYLRQLPYCLALFSFFSSLGK